MAGLGWRRPCARAWRPEVEGLEERLLLYAANGGQWDYPMRITYSIVPDGTSIGGYASNLYKALGAKYSQAAWQAAIQDAAAVWEAVASINLVQVSDDGSPIGVSGDQQGDSRFGDIRIGGSAQSLSLLAFAFSPPPINGGTNAGDIFFNTSQSWQINGSAYDLETVAIHEFGHALGMSHSAISSADMYASYVNSHISASSDDIAGVDSIYGARRQDAFDQSASDNTASAAANLMPWLNRNNQILMPNLDITGGSDVDWYKVQVPAGVSSMSLMMQATCLSSLRPRLQVYDANLNGLAEASTYTYGGSVFTTVSGLSAGQWLYIKALSSTSLPSAGGTYGLEVSFGSQSLSVFAPPYTTVASQPDQGGGVSGEGFNPLDLVLITVGNLTGYGEPDTLTSSLSAATGSTLALVTGSVGLITHTTSTATAGLTPALVVPLSPDPTIPLAPDLVSSHWQRSHH